MLTPLFIGLKENRNYFKNKLGKIRKLTIPVLSLYYRSNEAEGKNQSKMTTFSIRQDYDLKGKEGVILIDIKNKGGVIKQMRVAGLLDLEIELCALGMYSEEYSFGQAFAEGLFDGSLTKDQAAKMAETLKANPRATVSVLASNFIN